MRNCPKCKKQFNFYLDYGKDPVLMDSLLNLEDMSKTTLPIHCLKCVKNMKEINLNKLQIRIPEDFIVGRDEGNIQLLVEHEGGAKSLIKVFSPTFETDKGINVKFRSPETNTEYIRWFAGGKRHIELRDFANNPPRENPLIYIKVGAPATREYNNRTITNYNIIDYSTKPELL